MRHLYLKMVGWHRPLAWFTLAMLVLAVVCAVGWAVDQQTLVGSRIWAKPLKFSLSLAAYAVTLAWITSLLTRRQRLAWWAGTVLGGASSLEMVAIVGQVLRGRRSHFNIATSLDSAIFTTMGLLIAVIYLSTLVIAVIVALTRLADPVIARAVRLGIVLAIAGMSVGFLMLRATPEQVASTAAGVTPTLRGAHSVGVVDGGSGLPFLGWSTTGGDLRIGHFLGMHALQVLALLALVLGTPAGRRLGDATRLRVVTLVGVAWGALVALTVWQALRGQSIVRPDMSTLTAIAALVLLTGAGALAIARGRELRAAPRKLVTS